MDTELNQLMQRIHQLRDEDLWNMVTVDSYHYRPEALVYAKAEIERRGISDQRTEITTIPMPLQSMANLGNRLVSAICARVFHLGLLSSFFVFGWANYDSYSHMYEGSCSDCFVYFGYPFELYEAGGFIGGQGILWLGLLADVSIALTTGICFGWILNLLFHRVITTLKVARQSRAYPSL
jgi:hypothetical protein